MGALGRPPEEIGHKVAAALVGTFLGILLCYGFIGPLAPSMAKGVDEEHAYYHVLRVVDGRFYEGHFAERRGVVCTPRHTQPCETDLPGNRSAHQEQGCGGRPSGEGGVVEPRR